MSKNLSNDLNSFVNYTRRFGKQFGNDLSILEVENGHIANQLEKYKKLIECQKMKTVCDATTFSVFGTSSTLTKDDFDLEQMRIAQYIANKDSRKYHERDIIGNVGLEYIDDCVDVSITVRDGVKINVLRNALTRLLKLCDNDESIDSEFSLDNDYYYPVAIRTHRKLLVF